ncbi:MATE family efflux transporter [Marinoscillum sp. MHG1-6]|uniref:MATE family efflux transporter n=1 Tax=Marinoscillum sp. MHG1-6 TaxID=2959627 RepID=UPI002157973F|nr:MATE family efflux transporter [Marinoscillum sp. MHG1-6]
MRSFKNILNLFVSAVKGSEKEFTSGSINKAIFLLSVPMIFEMSLEAVFAIVDTYWVARIGVNAVATVGFTESMMMVIYSVAMGMSMAATALVARRVGEKDVDRASKAGFQAIFLGLVVSVVIGIIGFFYSEELLGYLGASDAVINEGVGFTRIMFLGNGAILLLFLINAVFRGAGDASIAMRSLFISNGLNIILDPLLIFGFGPIPAYGIEGAAIATTIGRSIGVCYQLFYLFNGRSIITLGLRHMVLRIKTLLELVNISLSGIGQFLIETASWIFLITLMSRFGMDAVAGYQIAFRVIVFTILPSWGMSNAAATLVGQNLGAHQPERAEQSVWKSAVYNMIFLGIVSIIFFIAAEPIIAVFSTEPKVLEVGVSALRIICLGYVFFAYGMVISQAFNGAGDTRTPLYINIVVFWFIQIPLAYWLAVTLNWQSTGVLMTIAIAHSLQAVISILLFRRGKWKLVEV